LDAIDAELYAHGVIWCQKFVDRVAGAYDRTVNGAPQRPGFLVSVGDRAISAPDNRVSVSRNSETATEIPQTKVKEIKLNNIYTVIFDHWNSKDIRVHRKLTDDMKRAINARTKDFSVDEILQSIDNYALILHGEEYGLMTYRWTLKEFLTGERVEKFLDLEIAKQNYTKKGGQVGAHRKGPTKLIPRTDYTRPEDY
ncbi:MAG: hypothetical protein HWN68_08145, partial [Desulfobacterales bacterium]|nr:hypothetical protein [Desulfobacterales bacterium]